LAAITCAAAPRAPWKIFSRPDALSGARPRRAESIQRNVGDLRAGPQRHFAVAMLADHVGVHVGHGDAEFGGEQDAEARSIQNRSGPEYPR
jgi:hypothetical protein